LAAVWGKLQQIIIALESQQNHCYFTLATKVALESATKIAPKIACVNGPLCSLQYYSYVSSGRLLLEVSREDG